jgi:hypothetical protein
LRRFESFCGVAVAELLALGVLVLVCFLASLAARTQAVRDLVESLEIYVLDKVLAYSLMKAETHSILKPEDIGSMQSASHLLCDY